MEPESSINFTAMERPLPRLHIDEPDFPDLKDARINDVYTLQIQVKVKDLSSLRMDTADKKNMVHGDLVILKVSQMKKYTFLFINIGGDFLSIAMRIKSEGYPVYYYKTKNQVKGREDSAVGLLTKEELVTDLFKVLVKFEYNKEELIILVDDNGLGYQFDYLRFEGWQIIGGSSFVDSIEYKQRKGLDLLKQIGLDFPYEKNFVKLDEGITFLKGESEESRFVFKPEGEEFAGSAKTYTGKNRQDLIDYLTWIKADCLEKHYDVTKFILQEFVEGEEADFAGFIGINGFMPSFKAVCMEEKKSGDGNKGEAVGCMGNVLLNVKNSRYFDIYIKPLEKKLKQIGYIGEISINNIFAKETGNEGKKKKYIPGQPYGIEYTPRMGWDAHLTEMAVVKKGGLKISDFYIALITGEKFSFPTDITGCG